LRLGQASAAGVGAAGQQSAQNIGNIMAAQGAAQAAGTIGAANAQAQGLGAISGGMQQGLGNYMMLQAVNRPTMASGIGTGGFYGSQAAAQSAYGPGFDVSYSAPAGPGGMGGWYGTPSA
jgi:hypothetical protein